MATKYPPANYLRVAKMNKSESQCPELIERTVEALKDEVLQQLLVSVQRTNLRICAKYAVKNVLEKDLLSDNWGPLRVMKKVLGWYPDPLITDAARVGVQN